MNDSRAQPPGLAELQKEFPEVELVLGAFSEPLLSQAEEIILSPGVALQEPLIQAAVKKGIPVVGDIELFAREAKAPIIGITGSNGKTTVTTLVGKMVEAAGLRVEVCGDIGIPVLDILNRPVPDFYVMELSSFQLETTHSLKAYAAVILNISSPDHMDRYATVEDYTNAKRIIYQNCQYAVLNKDEPDIWQMTKANAKRSYFTLKHPAAEEFGLKTEAGKIYLAYGDHLLIDTQELKLKGLHHYQNALASLALGHAMQLPFAPLIGILKNFSGLDHRCQLIGQQKGIYWYNDSKGTNVGATITAIVSMGMENKGRLILIAGGDSKKADLWPLQKPIEQYVAHVILLGQDAALIENVIKGVVPFTRVDTLEAAVSTAASLAKDGDSVLLSPACASWDMFKNYEHRGQVFVQAVEALVH